MITQTFSLGPPRADLNKSDFDLLIQQKGRDIIIETSLQCPCKSKDTNQQSNCKNCGGTGWVFINPRQTRAVLTGINIANQLNPWSEYLRGTMNVTCHIEDQMAEMDRITILDGLSIHNEVLFLKKKGDLIFTYTTYDIKQILYVALFNGENSPLLRLQLGKDYSFKKNILSFHLKNFHFSDVRENSITIRYRHYPQYHIIEMKREDIQSFIWTDRENLQNLPIAAIARKAHYQLSAQNLAGDRLIDNSFELIKPCSGEEEDCECGGSDNSNSKSEFSEEYTEEFK